MTDWLADRARATPDRTAVIDAADGRTWSYAALDEAVSAVAGRLRGWGVRADDRVGTLLTTRPAFATALFAVQRLDGVLVPMDPRGSVAGTAERCETADVDHLLCEASSEALAADAAASANVDGVATVDDPERDGVTDLGAVEAAPVDGPGRDPAEPLVLPFTSGTTGDPKAVVLAGGHLRASAEASAYRLGVEAADRWYDPLPVHHLGGLSPIVRATLYGTAVVLDREFGAGRALDALAKHGCTGTSLVPTMLGRLLEHTPPDGDGSRDDRPLAALRFVLLGGAPATADLLRRARDAEVPVCPTYGLTETASQVATALPAEVDADPESVGRPLFGTDVAVVDENGDRLSAGETGAIVVSGPTVADGYLGDDVATADRFRDDGFHTGDLGRLDETGRLRVLGRLDDAIVTGGEVVQPRRVAEAIRDHPGVADAVVVGVDDPEWGERVAALVVPAADDPPTLDELRAHCESRLAPHERPRSLAIAAAVPRTSSGTVDRETVRTVVRESTG